MRSVIIVSIFILSSSFALPDTIHVPADYSTIQEAIDASIIGDVVMVAPGTYVENIDFKGKEITVESSGGPYTTVIDGGNHSNPDYGSTIIFNNGESANSVITGFTIRNGTGSLDIWGGKSGGGIYCVNDSSPTIFGNIIHENHSGHWGGGIFCCNNSSPSIINNIISFNSGNNSYGRGGGIGCHEGCSPLILNNIISNNFVPWDGGGVCFWGNCNPIIKGNTITKNIGAYGGGVYCSVNCNLTISNSIHWKNSSGGNSDEFFIAQISDPSIVTIHHSLVDGGQSSVLLQSGCTLNWGPGMIDADPLFGDPANNDYHLQQDPCQPGITNPCVDAGDPASPMINGTTRTDGVQDAGVVDMGYHYPISNSGILHVPGEYPTIQSAIDASNTGDVVLVAPGTFIEVIDFKGKEVKVKSSGGPRVTVIDGYQSGDVVTFTTNETLNSELYGFNITNGSRGVYCNNSSPFIFNNIISTNQGAGIKCSNNSGPAIQNNIATGNYGPGIASHESSPNILCNIICYNGNPNCRGGGILCEDFTTSIIRNNIIYENNALWGGGIYCFGNSSIVVLNNTIVDNNAVSWGGGINVSFYSYTESVNTVFWNNEAPEGPELAIMGQYGPCTLKISYSDAKGGKASVYINSGAGHALKWGPGMIDADPLFADPVNEDFHLSYNSSCRDAGSNSHACIPIYDFESDFRIVYGTVDIGADEFYTHLYVTGDMSPNGSIECKLVGVPETSPTGILIGTDLLSSPLPTEWGLFYLQTPLVLLELTPIPADGILVLPATLPAAIPPPYDVPMQALIGLSSDSLTNLYVLEVR